MTNENSTTHPAIVRLEAPVARRLLAYRSKLLSGAQATAWLDDLKVAVAQVPPTDVEDAIALCSTGARFLADTGAPTHLAMRDVFTPSRIDRWLATATAAGRPMSTVRLARIRLEYLRRSLAGAPMRAPHSTTPRAQAAPFSERRISELTLRAALRGGTTLAAFTAVVGAGVAFVDLAGGSWRADGSSFVDRHGVAHLVVPGWQCIARSSRGVSIDADALTHLRALCPGTTAWSFDARLRASGHTQLAAFDMSMADRIRRYRLGSAGLRAMVDYALEQQVTDTQRRSLRDGVPGIAASGETRTLGTNPPASGGSGGVRVKRLSASELQRRARRAAERANTVPEFDAAVKPLIDGYMPAGADAATWLVVGPVVREVLARAEVTGPEAFRKYRGALAAYLLWRHEHRDGVSLDVAMRASAIDDFVTRGMEDYAHKTRLDYRTRLDGLARKANPGEHNPARPVIPRQPVHAGYTLAEEATIRRVALRQRTKTSRQQLCGVVGLAGGAGLDSSDLRSTFVRDVRDEGDAGIAVHVHGSRPRVVIVRRAYEEVVRAAIAGRRPNERVVGGSEHSRGVTGRVIENAELWDAPSLNAARLRTTWLAWLVQQPVPLAVVLDASGLRSAHTLSEIVALLPDANGSESDIGYLRGEAL